MFFLGVVHLHDYVENVSEVNHTVVGERTTHLLVDRDIANDWLQVTHENMVLFPR